MRGMDRPFGLQEVETRRISKQSAHEGGKNVSPTHRPEHHNAAVRIKSMKSINDLIGNRTRYLPAFSHRS